MPSVVHCFDDELEPAWRLARVLDVPVDTVRARRFPDGETALRVPPAAPTVIVYRSLDRPDAKLIEILLAADAWRRRGAKRLVLVAPYLCYMRQDAIFVEGELLSQTVIATLLSGSFDRIVTVDAHLHRTPSIEDLPGPAQWTNAPAAPAIASKLAERFAGSAPLVVGPDSESAAWTCDVAQRLGAQWTTLVKTRHSDREVSLALPVDVNMTGRSIVIVDDICSSGGTMLAAVGLLTAEGAASIDIAVTHALFPEEVGTRLLAAGVRAIMSTDSCLHPTNAIPLAHVLAETLALETTQ